MFIILSIKYTKNYKLSIEDRTIVNIDIFKFFYSEEYTSNYFTHFSKYDMC